ncbi:Ribosomal protein S18 acetylase RimI [Soonwooa buanensis]|uniref:Ribosomal protein S18 acetylase RimI n=1 Tax=Soonwooa buanensis TaxID=619805 RepID=A0A1T5GPA3_9FLAO|nr:GNAT family N-acetyltransferase [Soonwooa buanensis]SKC10201.1 Ribosomal protein S18 acetylase RimI [Soonwooa buanensis]
MIRKVDIKDLDALSKLFDSYRIFYHKNSDIEAAKVFLAERIKNKESEIFVAEFENNLVGFVQLFPIFSSTRMQRYWLLNDLFVDENYRGKAYSKALLEAAKELCRDTNACGMLLETGKQNEIGNQLYPACGFKKYDEVNFYEWVNE